MGPLGRSGRVEMNFGDGGCGTAITYSQSRGLYAGLSLEGSAVFSRPDVNHRFYGRVLSPMELLKGVVEPPRAARSLYDALDDAIAALPQPIYRALSTSRYLDTYVCVYICTHKCTYMFVFIHIYYFCITVNKKYHCLSRYHY
jgi:hypothetical protein